jgi:hypothetical protein
VLELLGPTTWRLPRWLETRLPHINIEGSTARALPAIEPLPVGESSELKSVSTEPEPVP